MNRTCGNGYILQNITRIYILQQLKKLAFNFPHVRIIYSHHYVKERRETFKNRG